MIPKIITIHDDEEGEIVIRQLIAAHTIDRSHVMVLRPEKEELTIDQIRLMQKDVTVSFSRQVLIVLYGLDVSGAEVQNSLLKIIEEESERLYFVFLVKDISRLLPTVISRCSLIGKPLPLKESTYVPFSFTINSESTRDEAIAKIDTFLLSHSLKNSQQLRYIVSIRKLILDNNVNPILALDSILLFLTKNSTMNAIHEK